MTTARYRASVGPNDVINLRSEHDLVVIGGAPRAGKTQVAKFLWHQMGLPGMSMDSIVASFRALAPGARIDWGETPERARSISVAASFIGRAGLDVHGRYALEGESMTPAVATALKADFAITSCFLVLRDPRLDDVLEHEMADPWIGQLPAHEQRQALCDIARRSEWLIRECGRFGLPYVDMTDGSYSDRVADVVAILGESRRLRSTAPVPLTATGP